MGTGVVSFLAFGKKLKKTTSQNEFCKLNVISHEFYFLFTR